MTFAFYVPSVFKSDKPGFGNFIVETLFLLIQQLSEHRFIIITDKESSGQFSFRPNTEIIVVKPISKNALLKKLWWDIKLPAILKKTGTDFFISPENVCSLTASIPQCIVIRDIEQTKAAYVKKARLMIVTNKLMKNGLTEKYKIPGEKVAVIYPSPNKMYDVINTQEKEIIKNKYSDGKEFFLFNSTFSRQEDFVNLLKSFSHFKKRQQSNFKLLLTAPSTSFFEKNLAGYKYRNDVRFIDAKEKKDPVLLTGSAYAVVLPFNTNENMIAALNAMRSAVPVIAVKNSVISEVAGDAGVYAETASIKDIGEKMMQIYTDENHRSKLIEKGKQAVAAFTYEKAAELFGQSILKVLQ